MQKRFFAVSTLVLLLSGCSWSQGEYHAGIRQGCQAKGLLPDTPAFQECFARELHEDHSFAPSINPRFKGHDWRHDME